MPIYEYVCQACEHAFERRQSFSDDPILVCPVCEEEAVKRLISVPGVVFKGSGWYIKDSKKSGALAGSAGTTEGSDASGESVSDDGGGAEAGASEGSDAPAEGKTSGEGDAKKETSGAAAKKGSAKKSGDSAD